MLIFLPYYTSTPYEKHVDFGDIGFDQSIVRNIRLQNTGKVPALYQIKDSRESLQNKPGQTKALLRNIGIHITPTKVCF